jgi:uncharacterized protein (DUF1684 family)
VLAACADRAADPPPRTEEAAISAAEHRAEIEAWRAQREERLRAEGGWLALAGLHWLGEGAMTIGSNPMADVVLPSSAPLSAGRLVREGAAVWLEPAPGVEARHEGERFRRLEMRSDASEEPTVVELGSLSLQVIERGQRIGLRVKDAEAAARTGFTGIESFPIDRRWRLTARLDPYEPPREMMVDDYTGGTQEALSPGSLVFEVDGESHRLDALDAGDELFVIFADRTSGRSTYGAGRYLYVDKPGPDGLVTLNFNQAYNPPCAFSPFATCPLPPRQNRLDLEVEAGEKDYHGPGAHGAAR